MGQSSRHSIVSNFSFVSLPWTPGELLSKEAASLLALCLITAVTVGAIQDGLEHLLQRRCHSQAALHGAVCRSKRLDFQTFLLHLPFPFSGMFFPLFTCCMSACQFFKVSLRPSFCPLFPDHSGGGRSPCVCPPVFTLSNLCHSYILLVPAMVASAVILPVLCGSYFDPLHSTAVTSFV